MICRNETEKVTKSCFFSFGCFSCIQKPQKKSNKGLVTFDKRQYFPIYFIEQVGANTLSQPGDKDSKSDKKLVSKKSEQSKKPIVVQGLDEDGDNPLNNNNEDDEAEEADRAGNNRIEVADRRNSTLFR